MHSRRPRAATATEEPREEANSLEESEEKHKRVARHSSLGIRDTYGGEGRGGRGGGASPTSEPLPAEPGGGGGATFVMALPFCSNLYRRTLLAVEYASHAPHRDKALQQM